MPKDFARRFYSSQAWNNCRASYMKSVNHLCERCLANGILKPAEIVHHKTELTPENINNPSVTLDHDNLQAVCRDCHAAIHMGPRRRRYKIFPDGSVEVKETS